MTADDTDSLRLMRAAWRSAIADESLPASTRRLCQHKLEASDRLIARTEAQRATGTSIKKPSRLEP